MKVNKRQFKVVVEQGEDGLMVASVPSLPGCHTQAKDLQTLRKRVREAIALCLEVASLDSNYRHKINTFAYEPIFVGLESVAV